MTSKLGEEKQVVQIHSFCNDYYEKLKMVCTQPPIWQTQKAYSLLLACFINVHAVWHHRPYIHRPPTASRDQYMLLVSQSSSNLLITHYIQSCI